MSHRQLEPRKEIPLSTLSGRLIGVLPTYRRTHVLAMTLEELARQTRPLDLLIIVDNEGNPSTEALVRGAGSSVEYLSLPDNEGFCGGVAAGMRYALRSATDDDWIVVLDDDDPPRFVDALERLHRFAEGMRRSDPRTAAVGISGGGFDWRKGTLRRIPDAALRGSVAVEHLASNNLPLFRVGAVREVGTYSAELFFGFEELEYGRRLLNTGHTLYGHGELWIESRHRAGRIGHVLRPSMGLDAPTWRDYYSLRNLIFILRRFGHPWTAIRVTLERGLAKPLWNLPRHPSWAARRLRVNAAAIRDGWAGHLGKRVEPDGSMREGKAVRALPLSAASDREGRR